MNRTFTVMAALAALCSLAQGGVAQTATADGTQGAVTASVGLLTVPAAEVDIDSLKWVKRPLVVFADTPADPRFVEQMNLLAERPDALAERDVVIIVDTDPSARSDVRLQLRPRGFQMAIISKEGTVVMRKPVPWSVREITRAIDKIPLRQDEIRRAREGS